MSSPSSFFYPEDYEYQDGITYNVGTYYTVYRPEGPEDCELLGHFDVYGMIYLVFKGSKAPYYATQFVHLHYPETKQSRLILHFAGEGETLNTIKRFKNVT